MDPTALLLLYLVQLALLAVGALWARWLLHRTGGGFVDWLGLGGALALFGLAALAHLLGPWFTIGRLLWSWAALGLAGLVLNLRRHESETSLATGQALLGIALLVVVLRTLGQLPHAYPTGWDPTFHTLLAGLVQGGTGLPTTWQPYEAVTLSYPLGCHVWLAALAELSGQPLHQAFSASFPVVAGLSTLVIGRLGEHVAGPRAGILAAGFYGLAGSWGSWQYFNNGGLPNAMGCYLMAVVIWLLLQDRRRFGTVVEALVFGSLLLYHHLSALIGGFVLASYPLAMRLTTGRLGPSARRVLRTLGLAALLFAPYAVPYALQARTLGQTSVLKFQEEAPIAPWEAPFHLGWVLVAMGLIGAWLVGRKHDDRAGGWMLHWWVALLVGFVGLDQLYRLGAQWLYGEPFSAFTPSRWLTDMVYPLAVLAGVAAGWLIRRLSERPERHHVLTALAVGLLLIPAGLELMEQRQLETLPPELAQEYQQIGEAMPADAVLFESFQWAPYLTGRETLATPLPASEPRYAEGPAAKRTLRDLSAFAKWLEEQDRTGYVRLEVGRSIPRGVWVEPVMRLDSGVLAKIGLEGDDGE